MTIYTTKTCRFPKDPDMSDVYPDAYRIETRRVYRGIEQRHIWMWDSGKTEVDEWIPSILRDIPTDRYTEVAA